MALIIGEVLQPSVMLDCDSFSLLEVSVCYLLEEGGIIDFLQQMATLLLKLYFHQTPLYPEMIQAPKLITAFTNSKH